jgi:hypothetical protein
MNWLGGVWQLAADKNGYLASFKLKKKTWQLAITFWSGMSHPTKSEWFAGGRRVLKAGKTRWGLISKPILDIGFFFKANDTTKYRKEVVRKSRYS